jgi:hypothetical protein
MTKPRPPEWIGAPSAPGNREQVGQLLRHAFPVSGSGSFTDVLEAIRTAPGEIAWGRVVTLPPI